MGQRFGRDNYVTGRMVYCHQVKVINSAVWTYRYVGMMNKWKTYWRVTYDS